jgi:hypothetical protein
MAVMMWCPNTRILCTFTISAHLHLLASTRTSHLVHPSEADQAEGLVKLGVQHLSSRNLLLFFSPFSHYPCQTDLLGYSCQVSRQTKFAQLMKSSTLRPDERCPANAEDASLRMLNDISTHARL